MTEPTLWVCPSCQTTNSVADLRCVVCDESHAGLEHGESTVLYASRARAPAPAPGPVLPAAASPPSAPRGGSGTVWALVTVFGVLVVLTAVLAVVALTRSSTDTSSPPTSTVIEATTSPPTSATTIAPTTVITVATTTARASAERAPAGTPSSQLDALDLAQELATALAHDDWGRVRELEPAKSGLADAQFASQYSDLDESTALLVSATDLGGGSYSLRLGLVAHQNGSQTSLYCVTWVSNTSSGTVTESSAGTRTLLDHGAGTLDPLGQFDRLRSEC